MTDGTVTDGTSTGGTVTVGSGGSGGTGLSGTVGSCGAAIGVSLVNAEEGAVAGAVDEGDDGFGLGACAGWTGAGVDRRVAGAADCVTTRPVPFGRPTSFRGVALRGSDVWAATRWRYAVAASRGGSTTVGLERFSPTLIEGNGDGAKPRRTITLNRTNVAPAAQAQSLTLSRRDAWTLMLPLSG